MLKYILALLMLALAETNCTATKEEWGFRPYPPTPESRQEFERLKREFLQIEDLKIGTGPIAAWGRKITADVVIRYVGDGTIAYQGPVLAYWGMEGTAFIHNSLRETGGLSLDQTGILLGLNGMAVGGKRFFTIPPKLVCAIYGSEKADPGISCGFVSGDKNGVGGMAVRKEALNVEATLTGSCIPGFAGIPRVLRWEALCRNSDVPRRDPSAPIWRFYYAEPSHP